eukprot:403996-Rhodomonas_salina.1
MTESRPRTPPSAPSTTYFPDGTAPKPLHAPVQPSASQSSLKSKGWAGKSTLHGHALLHMSCTRCAPSTVLGARPPLPPPRSVPCSKNAATVDCA